MICSGLNDKCDGCGKRLTAGVQRICKPRRPHEYRVTTVIPFKGETWTLPSVIDSHRRQTERPYIMLIDTGANTRDSIERGKSHFAEVFVVLRWSVDAMCETHEPWLRLRLTDALDHSPFAAA